MTGATADVKALTDGDLFRQFSAVVRAIPAFSEADRRSADALGTTCAGYHDEPAIPAEKHAALGRPLLEVLEQLKAVLGERRKLRAQVETR